MIYAIYGTTMASIIILFATIVALVRGGHYKRYPIFFGYLILLAITAAADLVVYSASHGWANDSYSRYYWANEAVRQFAVFVLVLSLIDLANQESPNRNRIRRWLVLGSIAVLLFSWFYHQSSNFNLWMTTAARDVSFIAVILNFLLWSLLIKYRRGGTRLLMVTGALGLEMAGEAIGQSLRQMGARTQDLGNIILIGSYLTGLLLWWFTFRGAAPDLPSR